MLLGPSGCGKTTTMRCVAGLETPTAGSIRIGGTTVFDHATGIDVPIEERRVGMVFQSYAIWPHMTVFENVAFPLQIAGISRAETRERVDEMLALVGLDDFAERGASYLSGGQMQRVALARSLVHRPQVLLMDEPLSNLDARLRDRLRVLLRELQLRFKTTALYVTHDQQEALALADRIVVLDAGSVLQAGDPVDLYRAPASRTVAEFLGYGNLFAATFEAPGIVALGSGGQRLTTTSAAGEQTAYAACIRPSDVRLTKADAIAAARATSPNVLHGVVVMASFLGSYVQYRVDVAGLIWEAHCAEPPPDVRVGTDVALAIDPNAVLVVPAT